MQLETKGPAHREEGAAGPAVEWLPARVRSLTADAGEGVCQPVNGWAARIVTSLTVLPFGAT